MALLGVQQKSLGSEFPKTCSGRASTELLGAGRAVPGRQRIPPRVSQPWGTPHGGRSQAEAGSWPLLPPKSQRFRHQVPEPSSSRQAQEVQQVVGTGPRPPREPRAAPGTRPPLPRARNHGVLWGAGVHGVHTSPARAHGPSLPGLVFPSSHPMCSSPKCGCPTRLHPVPSSAITPPPYPCLSRHWVLPEAGQVVTDQLKFLMCLSVFSFFLLSEELPLNTKISECLGIIKVSLLALTAFLLKHFKNYLPSFPFN